jgi:EAL domain-containing protein (putative c-di-GMP-specific phosphodiesterase class I)
MALNFPLDVVLHPAALHRLEALRLASGIASHRIVIELTESRPVEDFAILGRSLEAIRTLGYGVAIDDVGPAVPRLAPLVELPFTSLKLDKERVRRVNTDPEARSFLQRTIASAKAHGLTVVAEGVETVEIWDAMRALGADEAQGFLVARPLPLAAVPVWLEHWSSRAQA